MAAGFDIGERFEKYKLVFLGDLSTGKTSIINQFMYSTFDQSHQPTIGVDFLSKTIHLESRTVRFQLWDTAGQERFRALIPSYIRDSQVAIIVYDITHRPSFESVNKWVQDVRTERGTDVLILVVGNKVDLEDRRTVTADEATEKATQLGVMFIETSAKDGTNIGGLFRRAAQELPGEMPDIPQKYGDTVQVTPSNNATVEKNEGCKC